MTRRLLSTLSIMLIGWGVAPSEALACAACSGKSNDAMVLGLNLGMLTLLVCLLFVFGVIGLMVVRMIRLQKLHSLSANMHGLSANIQTAGGMAIDGSTPVDCTLRVLSPRLIGVGAAQGGMR